MGIELLHMDCLDYMSTLEDNAFDLAIVDPPYGLPKDSCNGRGGMKGKAFLGMAAKGWDTAPPPEYFTELFRVSKEQIIWGGNFFDLPGSRGFVIWDKQQPWEKFSAAEFAWLSMNVPSKIFKFDCRQVGKKIHPTQKPLKMYEWLLEKFAQEGDRILDTHLGSGSSAIASHYAGYDFVGTELDKDYYDAACTRFTEETKQQAFAL